MKLLKTALLLLLLCLVFHTCEKDDICVDGDTPQLVIGFYDFEDREVLKEVPTLIIRGDDGSDTELETISFVANDSNTVSLPLRPTMAATVFILSQNPTPNDTTTVNTDTISLTYETTDKFVSRACGFVANYDNVEASFTTEADDGNWIKDIEVIVPLIENSNETHVKIYH
ncbi:hypothetical protein FGM00_10670 [Aggregatimonas sangjinii]|uniref:DUF1735 domain-containing protein n=1 Tax=Aggregatimonas sangjinii TaxID=2583587 RepID=A0A5B7SQQ4_9FLAO|nr:DUF6452 family protein [Aggregatimonas sangjinii]QCX00552.1 hypothetical protein FGM00_10670 [Aggregatimonas sangjinii]